MCFGFIDTWIFQRPFESVAIVDGVNILVHRAEKIRVKVIT